ncbi:hypothetical protein [Fundidesulfovibrio butyratiphilus]
MKKSTTTYTLYILILLLTPSNIAFSQQQHSSSPPTQQAGPLEFTATDATLTLFKGGMGNTIFQPNITVKIKNISASTVGILLCKSCFSASDNQGQQLFGHGLTISGASFSNTNPDSFQKTYRNELDIVTTLFPNQSYEVQFHCNTTNMTTNCLMLHDSSGKIHDTYNSTSVRISGLIALKFAAAEPMLIPFSLSNIPLKTFSR